MEIDHNWISRSSFDAEGQVRLPSIMRRVVADGTLDQYRLSQREEEFCCSETGNPNDPVLKHH